MLYCDIINHLLVYLRLIGAYDYFKENVYLLPDPAICEIIWYNERFAGATKIALFTNTNNNKVGIWYRADQVSVPNADQQKKSFMKFLGFYNTNLKTPSWATAYEATKYIVMFYSKGI